MPSDTVMVLKVIALAARDSTPPAAKRASPSMCMLQGVRLLQVEAIPTCGLSKSASVKPTARSIARLGVCFTPSTTSREYLRESAGDFLAMGSSIRRLLKNGPAACGPRAPHASCGQATP